MSYTRKAVSGGFFVFIGAVISAVLGYSINIVLARSLSLADYGLFFAVFGFGALLLFFRDCGLITASVKYAVEFIAKKDFDSVKTVFIMSWLMQLVSSLVLGTVLFLSADYLALNFFKNAEAAILLKLFFVFIISSLLLNILRSFFKSFKKFRLLALIESGRLFFALIGIFLFLEYRYLAPLIAYILGFFAIFVLLFPFVLRIFRFSKYRYKNTGGLSKKLILFGIPVLFTGIGARIVGRLDTVMLTYFADLEQVGIYNAILPSALVFVFFARPIAAVLFPFVADFWSRKDFSRLKDGIRLIHRYLFIMAIPFLLLLFVFSPLFIKIIFGDAFISGAASFQVLLIGVLLFLIATLNHTIISAIGRPGIVAKIVLAAAGLNAFLNIFLIPYFGILGAAITTSVCYAFMFVASSFYVSKLIKVGLPVFSWLKTFFAGGLFLGSVYILKSLINLNIWFEIIIISLLSFAIYVILILVFRLVDFSELKKYSSLALKKNK